jgi:hypothetical protein
MPKSSLSISESDLREVSVAVFGAFHHYLGVGVGEPEALEGVRNLKGSESMVGIMQPSGSRGSIRRGRPSARSSFS